MSTLEAFERHLREALTHLYDPAYHPSEDLWESLGCQRQQGVQAVQRALVQAIEALEPAPEVPPTARIRRIYDVLSYRYVQGLTQEQAAEHLDISSRHLRREQREAVRVLAERIWEEGEPALSPRRHEHRPAAAADAVKYRSQVKRELAALRGRAPAAVADVKQLITEAAEVGGVLSAKCNVSLQIDPVASDVHAALHPSALRQVLIGMIGQLLSVMSTGEIIIGVKEGGEGRVTIGLTAHPVGAEEPADSNFVQETVESQGGAFDVRLEKDRLCYEVTLPSANETTVLVVDDNPDLIHFYQRYTMGTRYTIVPHTRGDGILEAVAACSPGIIVLDVMLPDADGWELLTQLHEHHDTRSIPIVVCSVVRQEKLALALGASMYVPKPVRRQQFLRALNQVLSARAAGSSRTQTNNSAAC